MGIGPVPATQKVLARTGLSVGDLGAVELNEAFATQSLASMRRLGLDPEIVNRDGGAITLGHPLGSSGSRIAITLLGRMEREDAEDRPRHHVHRRRPGHRDAAGARVVAAAATGLDPQDFSTLLVDEREDRLVVLLNRPEVRNAIDQQMVDELHAVCAAAGADPEGPDHRRHRTGSSPPARTSASCANAAATMPCRASTPPSSSGSPSCPMPVIAALDGFCLGGGAELAYAADFRIGTPSVRIGNPETGLGILAAAGASWRLKELVGEPVAKEILLAGTVLRAERALAVNLITEIHEAPELMAAAHALADRIAGQDPLAVRITKSVFHAPRRGAPADRPAGAGDPLRVPGQVRPHAGFPG